MVLDLAFLSFGPGEVLVVLVLIVLLFGVDSAPRIAREFGKFQSRLQRTTQSVLQSIEDEQKGITPEARAAEHARELQMRSVVTAETGTDAPSPGKDPSGDKPVH